MTVAQTGIKEIAIGGGVSANSSVRNALLKAQEELGWKVHIPRFEFCTDNAAMIAIVGELKYKQRDFSGFETASKARMAF